MNLGLQMAHEPLLRTKQLSSIWLETGVEGVEGGGEVIDEADVDVLLLFV